MRDYLCFDVMYFGDEMLRGLLSFSGDIRSLCVGAKKISLVNWRSVCLIISDENGASIKFEDVEVNPLSRRCIFYRMFQLFLKVNSLDI